MKPMEELSTADLTPLPEPERSLRAAIAKMVQANNADRKELDWQVRAQVHVFVGACSFVTGGVQLVCYTFTWK